MESLEPRNRSRMRIYFGKKYFRMKRYMDWYAGKKKYALKKQSTRKSEIIATHQTQLLRELKDVDMWLQHNKITNLKIAIKQLNVVIVQPGETFSYWRLIGNTSKRKGYVEGMILHYGKVTVGVGGGLCQLSNLIYWITLHTPLQVKERYRHSYDVFPDSNRSQPFGSGATCAYNYLDLQIKNDTKQAYQLVLYLTDTHLVGEWRADNPSTRTYEVYEKDHLISLEYWGGYVRHNSIYRKAYNMQSELIDDEFITQNHAIMMYEPMLTTSSE
ncbi:VanW family protein [Psychrobacillus sp. BL-248-WT-3]|uniref:VanW family protein n=1 Tax=Psychrobacillus sp. BL-248-WT-3 TaxID=2725306 RepID=UPI00146BCCFF|nr:VanW family protein [Psychrobacillus sp. BL-248-WT-3]NME07428.1 VanW family protein [Psychrobacillus sp. BL-248-WT-3]